MRAVVVEEFGGPEVLQVRRVKEPVVGAGQALIEVEFVGVTFVETQVRAGNGPFEAELPMIPGNGVGGRVAAVGADSDEAWVGKRVVSSTGGTGGYAERAVADVGWLHGVPDALALDEAVALLADGRTATMLVRAAGVREGEGVLVEAAAGGVGTLLVQLARSAGAEVVAAAGGTRKAGVARGLGAGVAVDYLEPGWAERVREAVGPMDVVFDGVGGEVGREAFGLLGRGGRMVSFGIASGEWAGISDEAATERGVTLVRTVRPTPEEMRELTESALGEAASGRLRPIIGQRFPLEEAAKVHAAIEARRTVGKTLLVP